jgi:16S rRNA (guanine527-N7)-methyltransferase
MTTRESGAGTRLNAQLGAAGLEPVDDATAARFAAYLALLLRWNAKISLTAIRDEEEILARHFVESIACARALPKGITSLLDYGSGAGFPGIPIALCRPEIRVTLAESQSKKAAFLREVARVLGAGFQVYEGRAEALAGRFDCVTLRAVDRMPEAVKAAVALTHESGWLAVMTTGAELPGVRVATGDKFVWEKRIELPESEDRILALGRQANTRN